MTEAFQGEFYTHEVASVESEPVMPPPRLEIVREPMPAFVLTEVDRAWWKGLPGWRKELYLLPKASSEEERIRQINALGMSVVRYSAGKPPVEFTPYGQA